MKNYAKEYLDRYYGDSYKPSKEYDNALFIVGLVFMAIIFIVFVKSV